MIDRNQDTRDKVCLIYFTPAELARRLSVGPACLVLDVRNPHELEGELGRLPGGVNIPLQQLEQRLGEVSTREGRILSLFAALVNAQRPQLESFSNQALSESLFCRVA